MSTTVAGAGRIAERRFYLGESGSPLVTFALVNVFLVALALWDWRTRGRLHPATLWGGAIFVASQPLRIVLSTTPAWLAIARWMTGVSG